MFGLRTVEGGLARPRGTPSLCRAAIEPFRQLGEIDCHLLIVPRQKASVARCVWVGSTVKHAELHASGVLDGKSARDLDDPPRKRLVAFP